MAPRYARLPSPDDLWTVGDTRIIRIPIWEVEPDAAGQGGVPADPALITEVEFGLRNLRTDAPVDLYLGNGVSWAAGEPCAVDVRVDTEAKGMTAGEHEGALRITDLHGPRTVWRVWLRLVPSPLPLPSGRT